MVLKDPEKRWKVEQRKTNKVYTVMQGDVIIGLVRPERRNIGLFSHNECGNVFASPDGVAVVRSRPDSEDQYPVEWLFQALRTEQCRIQFWTESGGTSYGKLTLDQIRNVLIPLPSQDKIQEIADNVRVWSETVAQATEKFHEIWDSCDKVAILNSPLIGLEADSLLENLGTEEED